MADLEGRLCPNLPTIAAEEIDGEVVVVNFDSGHYYSLRDTGADIWRMLDAGFPVKSIIAGLGEGLPGATSAVIEFTSELRSEGLMVPVSTNGSEPPTRLALGPYSPPRLERFEEMAEMLLIDPIHDVDETGWPNLADRNGEKG